MMGGKKQWRKKYEYCKIKVLRSCRNYLLRKKALGSKWVYTQKYDEHGNLQGIKAKLLIFGHHEAEGIDYNETFSALVKMETIRTFLAIAIIKNWNTSDGCA